MTRLWMAAVFLAPGGLALGGGLMSCGVQRFFHRPRNAVTSLPESSSNLRVIEGRLRTIELPASASE